MGRLLQTILEMYEMTLGELLAISAEGLLSIISLTLVLIAAYRMMKNSNSKSAKTILISIIGIILSGFVSSVVLENSDTMGLLQYLIYLVPSLFILTAALGFYKLSIEYRA
ncbi:MAG: hypothetical protein GY951_16840 [Psychromonas sp.]|nr:hypothetical protein [Psychromonas sp.]